jgi:hypothetical protein
MSEDHPPMNKRQRARLRAQAREAERNFPNLPPELKDRFIRHHYGDSEANAWAEYEADRKEWREMLENNPSEENRFRAYFSFRRWTRYWAEHSAMPRFKKHCEESWEAGKEEDERVLAELRRWEAKHGIGIVRRQ